MLPLPLQPLPLQPLPLQQEQEQHALCEEPAERPIAVEREGLLLLLLVLGVMALSSLL